MRTKIIAFALYFLAGAEGALISGSLTHLVGYWGMELDKIVLFSSAYSLGRMSSVYITGYLVEHFGSRRLLFVGTGLMLLYLICFPMAWSYTAALVFAFLGGAGMTVQDTAGPLLMGNISGRRGYSGMLSIGQALFGIGGFAAPFLVGVFTSFGASFKAAFYLLALVPTAMLICLFGEKEHAAAAAEQSGTIQPLHCKNTWLCFLGLALFVLCYDAAGGILSLYATSYAKATGLGDSAASFVLSVYQVGGVVGSLVFSVVLRRISANSAAIMNLCLAAAAAALGLALGGGSILFLVFLLLGLFSRPVFSMMVSMATRVGYKHVSIVGSVLGLVSGAVGVLIPVVTGGIIAQKGPGFSIALYLGLCLMCIMAALVIKSNTKEKGEQI